MRSARVVRKSSIFLGVISCFLWSCSGKKDLETKKTSFPVKVVEVVQKDMPIFLDTIGHAEPIYSVEVKSRVEGQLMEVHFEEGDEVKEGDLLFTIDRRPYEAALKKAEASLDENQANFAIATYRLERNTPLAEKEYISALDFAEMKSNVNRIHAIVDQNQADIMIAKLNLDYCNIYAPIQGVTGALKVNKGNLVAADGATSLITINQIAPIYVTSFLSEKDLPRVQASSQKGKMKILVSSEDSPYQCHEGILDLIDNTVDPDTGMVQIRSIFENKDKSLWPGQFVSARIILEIRSNAIVIPFEALQITAEGPVVFVVKQDLTVERRPVLLGQRQEEEILIEKGLSVNEKIVTQGQINLFPGASVWISQGKNL